MEEQLTVQTVYTLIPLYILLGGFSVQGQSNCTAGSSATCTTLGIPNAYITTTGPYKSCDLVTYVCMTGFSMTGTPSQTCGSNGQWEGNVPVCTAIDTAPRVDNSQSVTYPETDMPIWLIIVLGGMMGLFLIFMVIVACLVYCAIRKDRVHATYIPPELSRERTKAKPEMILVQPYQPPRDHVMERCSRDEATTPSNVSVGIQIEADSPETVSRAQSPGVNPKPANGFALAVDQVVEQNKRAKPAKEVQGKWMPHSHNIRKINTSTK